MSAPLYGLLAELESADALRAAAQKTYAAGYRKLDAFSPFPIDGLAEDIGFEKTKMPLVVLIGGIIGAATAYGMQFYSAVKDYPLNVGGRPLHSWPSFVPITFEVTVLCAALAAVFGMLAMNHLPKPYHPLFNAPEFRLASQLGFFLCIEASDKKFSPTETKQFLASLGALSVREVEE